MEARSKNFKDYYWQEVTRIKKPRSSDETDEMGMGS
jgi:hypothetical protein